MSNGWKKWQNNLLYGVLDHFSEERLRRVEDASMNEPSYDTLVSVNLLRKSMKREAIEVLCQDGSFYKDYWIELVIFLAYEKRYDDINYICEEVVFEEGRIGCPIHRHATAQQTGILCYVAYNRCPLPLMISIVENVPSAVKGNAGLSYLIRYLDRKDEKQAKQLFHATLKAIPSALIKPWSNERFSYPSLLASRLSHTVDDDWFDYCNRYSLTFIARQWRVIEEISESLPGGDDVFVNCILPLLRNPGYGLLKLPLKHPKDTSELQLFKSFRDRLERMDRAVSQEKFTIYRTEALCFSQLVVDFLPLSVLVYNNANGESVDGLIKLIREKKYTSIY